MATLVNILCAMTSLACATLLWRSYRRSGTRLLLWSAFCFASMTVGNALLVADVSVGLDLSLYRTVPHLLGVAGLVYGLVWEVR
jgi:hypothetical protein